MEVNCKDGTKKYISIIHIRTASKEILIALNDITQQKIAEEELKKSEEKYRLLVENINDTIYNINEKGIVTYINPSIKNLIGYSPKDIIGKSLENFIHPDDLKFRRNLFKKVLISNSKSFECRFIDKKGRVHWAQNNSRVVSKKGEKINIQGTLIDITEQKKTEKKLVESYKHLGIMNRQIDILFKLNKKHKIDSQKETIESILSASIELFQANVSIFYTCDNKENKCTPILGWGLSKKQFGFIKKFPFRSTALAKSISKKKSSISGNLDEFGLKKIAMISRMEYISVIPIIHKKEVRGFIVLLFEKAGNPRNIEIFSEIFSFQIYPILHNSEII